jgi:hypothetical protein
LTGLGAVGALDGLDVAGGGACGRNRCDADQKKKDEAAAARGVSLAGFDWPWSLGSRGIGAVVEFDAVGFSFRNYFRVIAIDDFQRAAARADFERFAVDDRDFAERRHRNCGTDERTVRGDKKILVGREREGDRTGADVGANERFLDDGIVRRRAMQRDLRRAGHVKHGVAAAKRQAAIGFGDEAVAVVERGAVGSDAVAERGGVRSDDDAEGFDFVGVACVGAESGLRREKQRHHEEDGDEAGLGPHEEDLRAGRPADPGSECGRRPG